MNKDENGVVFDYEIFDMDISELREQLEILRKLKVTDQCGKYLEKEEIILREIEEQEFGDNLLNSLVKTSDLQKIDISSLIEKEIKVKEEDPLEEEKETDYKIKKNKTERVEKEGVTKNRTLTCKQYLDVHRKKRRIKKVSSEPLKVKDSSDSGDDKSMINETYARVNSYRSKSKLQVALPSKTGMVIIRSGRRTFPKRRKKKVENFGRNRGNKKEMIRKRNIKRKRREYSSSSSESSEESDCSSEEELKETKYRRIRKVKSEKSIKSRNSEIFCKKRNTNVRRKKSLPPELGRENIRVMERKMSTRGKLFLNGTPKIPKKEIKRFITEEIIEIQEREGVNVDSDAPLSGKIKIEKEKLTNDGVIKSVKKIESICSIDIDVPKKICEKSENKNEKMGLRVVNTNQKFSIQEENRNEMLREEISKQIGSKVNEKGFYSQKTKYFAIGEKVGRNIGLIVKEDEISSKKGTKPFLDSKQIIREKESEIENQRKIKTKMNDDKSVNVKDENNLDEEFLKGILVEENLKSGEKFEEKKIGFEYIPISKKQIKKKGRNVPEINENVFKESKVKVEKKLDVIIEGKNQEMGLEGDINHEVKLPSIIHKNRKKEKEINKEIEDKNEKISLPDIIKGREIVKENREKHEKEIEVEIHKKCIEKISKIEKEIKMEDNSNMSTKIERKKKIAKSKVEIKNVSTKDIIDLYKNKFEFVKKKGGGISQTISIFERGENKKRIRETRVEVLTSVLRIFYENENSNEGKNFEKNLIEIDPYLMKEFLDVKRILCTEQEIVKQLIKRVNVWKGIIKDKVDYSDHFKSILDIFTSFYQPPRSKERKRSLERNYTLLLRNLDRELVSFHKQENERGRKIYCKVTKNRREVYEIVKNAVGRNTPKWKEYPSYDTNQWNLLWSWSKPRIDRNKLLVVQKVNHFQNSKEICRKNHLYKNLNRYLLSTKKGHCQIIPQTFILPGEYIKFLNNFSKNLQKGKKIWILKPYSLSRGRGIRLFSDVANINCNEKQIVQKYIENPMLIDGYKFDLRLYVLVTCFDPLECFIYKEGLARYSSQKFTLDKVFLQNKFIHLTNTSIQQYSPNGVKKTNLANLRMKLKDMNISYDVMWNKCIDLILKTFELVNIANSKENWNEVNSFELFGFDVIFDCNFRPWLLEINSSPSMDCSSPVDNIKKELINDILKLVNPLYFDRFILHSVIKRRLNDYSNCFTKKNLSYESMKDQLNDELKAIFHGGIPRKVGEMPRCVGNFQRIAKGR